MALIGAGTRAVGYGMVWVTQGAVRGAQISDAMVYPDLVTVETRS